MPEQLPNQANTTGSFSPTPQDPLEVTPQDINGADAEDIRTAALEYLETARTDMGNPNAGQRSQELASRRVKEANATLFALNDWRHSNEDRLYSNQLTEPFRDFLDRAVGQDNVKPHIYDAYIWAGDRSYDGLVGKAIRARRQEALKAEEVPTVTSHSEQLQAESIAVAGSQEAERQQKASDEAAAREAVEQARGVEIFDDIVSFAKDKTHLYTDIHGFTPLGDAKPRDSSRTQIPQSILQEARKNPDYRQHLNEAVMFSGLTESDKRTVTKERHIKGRFGLSHSESYTETEVVPNSEHPVMIRNEQTGQDEPSVRFRYNFQYSNRMSVDDRTALPKYQEFQGGRSGQTVQVSIDLPESMASKLKAQIEHEPSSVRELVEELFLNNHDGKMTEEYWRKGGSSEHPIRPPYEKLPEDWTIAVIDNSASNSPQGYKINRLATNPY